MITAKILNRSERVRHAFFTRAGGVSEGLYDSLNCGFGSGDNPDHVAANRSRALNRLGGDSELLTLYQVHSPDVVVVENLWQPDDAPKADAQATSRPETSDCIASRSAWLSGRPPMMPSVPRLGPSGR